MLKLDHSLIFLFELNHHMIFPVFDSKPVSLRESNLSNLLLSKVISIKKMLIIWLKVVLINF